MLQGKRIGLSILDTGNNWCFIIDEFGLHFTGYESRPCDVHIRGSLVDFLRLAMRLDDPDTLFFNRRLIIEGQTETGLAIKNMIDSMDIDWSDRMEESLGPVISGYISTLVIRTGLKDFARKQILHALSE